jgi:YbgC/YbaW family acyl-CoA thioester hydrolase
MPYEFQVTRRVEFSETDLAGIMHFSNFFRFMESAEHAFFRSLGFSVIGSRSRVAVCLPRVHAECDYAVPLRFEDVVLIRLLVERKGQRSLTYQFRFCRLGGAAPEEVARGRLTVASVERQADGGMKSVPLPKAITSKIQQAPAQVLADGFHDKANSSTPQEPRFARDLPTILPLPFGRGEGRGEGSGLGVRGSKRGRMSENPLPARRQRERPKRPTRPPSRNLHRSATR